MKCRVPAVALFLVGLPHPVAHANEVAHADEASVECFSSPEAVLEAHPGSHAVYTTHATWWSVSSKCWFAGSPAEKPMIKPRAAMTVAAAPSPRPAQALPPQPKQAVEVPYQQIAMAQAYEENIAPQPTYEESAAALRALMFGPDESPTDFEGRFSAVRNTPTLYVWRRCLATPIWDLCKSST
jgi:hypothetical protein